MNSIEAAGFTRLLPQIKVCGITRAEDAERAEQLGADALGLILVPISPRRVLPEQAKDIRAVVSRACLIGVFQNAPLDEVVWLVEELGLDGVQLHGDESPDYCASLRETLQGRVLIKARRFSGGVQLAELKPYADVVDAVLVDGTFGGGPLPWHGLAGWREQLALPMVLAGGLNADNVGEAIQTVRPAAVDVARGVEVANRPGVKDVERLEAFIRRVRSVARPEPVDAAVFPVRSTQN